MNQYLELTVAICLGGFARFSSIGKIAYTGVNFGPVSVILLVYV